MYPRISSGLIAHDPSYKSIATMPEYKRHLVPFSSRGINLQSSDLTAPVTISQSPAGEPAAPADVAGATGVRAGSRGQPNNLETVELRRAMARREKAILDRLMEASDTRAK